MPEPILAKEVIIQFMSGGNYVTYGCAAELETTFSMTTKSVKTIGDGVWKRSRGQSLAQVVSLSGVIKKDDTVPDAFDLLDYFKNMADVDFRIIFYDELGVAKILKGIGLPTEVVLSAGSEGHANGSITIECNGDPDMIVVSPDPDDPDDCVAEIEDAHVEQRVISPPDTLPIIQRWFAVVDSMVSGSADISRWDYSVDGGGTQTAFTDGNIPAEWMLPLFVNPGPGHSMTITPICDNGFSGEPFTFNFTT